jgi:PA14 domain/Cytochrome C oxidase, cbb3-type, subunit III
MRTSFPPQLDWLMRKFLGPLTLLIVPGIVVAADSRSGEQIYRQRCASCHGPAGEGTEEHYPQALTGKRTAAQLVRFISRSMPKDDPKKCTGADAEKVAAYIFDAFYSPAAQARNKPPRIELARLTVRQYRNAVADLIGSFRGSNTTVPERGLKASYFKSFGFRTRNRAFERTDPLVQFNFGEASPEPKKLEAHAFSIRWEGAVIAPETGEYDFVVRTEHAARLWVNDLKHPLVDGWVKSGPDLAEHHASLFLLGGRAYPLRLEFSKGKQGEADGKKTPEKHPPVKASIALEWKLPHRAAEPIPERNLTPGRAPEALVVATPFPPDDRSVGYERGTSISKAWDQATTDAAIEIAGYIVAHLRELSGVSETASDRRPRLRDFCLRLAERAFRRPLSEEQKRLYVDHQFEASRDLDTAVKRVVLLVLQSPPATVTMWRRESRLRFGTRCPTFRCSKRQPQAG